ncbi:MAG: ribulose-phosphate 3-epimerase [Lachnospiraceae bacterium]|nr:ribulose-phosphate 3-epimerase [Lachnospiraceae bacterium]MDE6698357.1 ribulose-phosphate 3-epimerase [Lachnospiraceae bacterium]
MIKLSPSILACDYNILGKQVKEAHEAGAVYMHLDVMDGLFVPSISFGMPVIKSLRKSTDVIFDTHLMIKDPIRYIDDFVASGSDIITFHLEATNEVEATIDKIKAAGIKAGIVINPETPVEEIKPYLNMVDMVLIMSVHPGFGGQKYIEQSTEKIRKARKLIDETGRNVELEVDGGINLSNIDEVLEAGANVIVAGSAVFGETITKNVKEFLEIFNKFERG